MVFNNSRILAAIEYLSKHMKDIINDKLEVEETDKGQEQAEYVVLEGFSEAMYYQGKIQHALECRVIKFGNQPTDDEIVPDIWLKVRSDVDIGTVSQLLADMRRLVLSKVETDFVSEQIFEPPYGIFTFPYPDVKIGSLMQMGEEYFCTCDAEFHEHCNCKEAYGSGYSNIISEYD